MKKMRTLAAIVLVISMLLISAMSVGAQDGTWVSGIMIQNQSSDQIATVTVKFYWAEGTALAGQVAYEFTDTIQAGKAKSYYTPSMPLPDDFVGAAVVSSDQPVAANVNTQLPSGTGATPDNPNRVGTSSGVADPSDTLYFTQVMKAYYGWNSYASVQNTADTQASVTIRYYNGSDGALAATQTVTVKPFSNYIFRQSENTSLPGSWIGSAVVEGDQPLAGVVNFFAAGDAVSTAQFQSYNAAADGATKLFVPRVVRDYYGYNGGLMVQNVGTAATDVTVTYYFGGNTYVQTLTALAPSAGKSVYLLNVAELDGVAGSGSAVITSSGGQKVVATINEDNRTLGQGATYNAIPMGSEATGLLFPQVTGRFYGYSGGIQVQNVGTATANVQVTFSASGFTDVVIDTTVNANQSKSWFAPDVISGPNFNGSVVITSDQPIVGIGNMAYRQDKNASDGWPTNVGDAMTAYNAFAR